MNNDIIIARFTVNNELRAGMGRGVRPRPCSTPDVYDIDIYHILPAKLGSDWFRHYNICLNSYWLLVFRQQSPVLGTGTQPLFEFKQTTDDKKTNIY